MFDSRELERLQNELAENYIAISKAYARMSKAKDLLSRNIIQSGIDEQIKKANALSDKTEALKKKQLDNWQNSKTDGLPKSKHD